MPVINFLTNSLHYCVKGNGSKHLILFHGFGQDHQVYDTWYNQLSDKFKIIAIDLPYHGLSSRSNQALSKEEWYELFKLLLQTEKIESFSLCGYSLGGRFALTTAYHFHRQINQLYLIAPDGIHKNRWYRLATGPGRVLFKFLMKNPDRFFKLLDWLDRHHLVQPSISKFARQELFPKENRIKVYQSWVYLKPLGHKKSDLIERFNREEISIHLLVGDKDYIVKPSNLIPTFNKMKKIEIKTLPVKHHQLIDGSFGWIN